MNLCYLMLKPVRLNQQKYIGLFADILDDKAEMENLPAHGEVDSTRPTRAGEAFRQFPGLTSTRATS